MPIGAQAIVADGGEIFLQSNRVVTEESPLQDQPAGPFSGHPELFSGHIKLSSGHLGV